MTTKCLIIDDEPLAIGIIASYIEKIPQMEVAATCSNALEGFEVLKSKQVDLIFLDIQMPMITGIEFLKSINNPPKVIFTTAYRDYAIESYELEVVDYLLKPIPFDRFFKAINKYLGLTQINVVTPSNSTKEASDSLFVNMNKKHFKIFHTDILYVESLKDYIKIHTTENRFTTKQKISDLEQILPANFLRIHRSFIVNLNKITAFTANDIEIGKIEVPIGISYRQQVNSALQKNS